MNKKKIFESKVIVENGEVKTIFSEEIQRTGYMNLDEFEYLMIQSLTKISELNYQNESKD